MNKTALYRNSGRDIGFRFAIEQLGGELSKTADADPESIKSINLANESLEYTDMVTKCAHNTGTINAFQMVLDVLEKGASVEELKSNLSSAIEAKVASTVFPASESEEETLQLQEEMVKGAAEAIGSVSGLDPTSESVLNTAIDLVVEAMENA